MSLTVFASGIGGNREVSQPMPRAPHPRISTAYADYLRLTGRRPPTSVVSPLAGLPDAPAEPPEAVEPAAPLNVPVSCPTRTVTGPSA